MNIPMEYLPLLIPYLVIELALAITALVSVLRHKTFRFGNKILWVILVLFLQIIGPVLYFTAGRGDE